MCLWRTTALQLLRRCRPRAQGRCPGRRAATGRRFRLPRPRMQTPSRAGRALWVRSPAQAVKSVWLGSVPLHVAAQLSARRVLG